MRLRPFACSGEGQLVARFTRVAAISLCSAAALLAVAGPILRFLVTDAKGSNRMVPVSRIGSDGAGEFLDFPAKSFAAHPGMLCLTPPSGCGGRLVLGPSELHANVVRRPILVGNTAAVRLERRGRLSGHLGETPEAFGLRYESLKIGAQQVWRVDSPHPDPTNVWVIHVHGLGSRRSQTLRGVETFAALGFTSIIPTYSTSLDSSRDGVPRSNLGVTEWRDIARVQDYALAAGAKKVLYVGWSLGASMVLRTVQQIPRAEVKGAVLISPALDWKEIVLAALASNRVPKWLGVWALCGFNFIRQRGGIAMSWSSFPGTSSSDEVPLPILVFHGTNDNSVPIRLSRDFAHRSQGKVRLVEFPGAHHTLEWNSNPELWQQEIKSWCTALNLLGNIEPLTDNLETA